MIEKKYGRRAAEHILEPLMAEDEVLGMLDDALRVDDAGVWAGDEGPWRWLPAMELDTREIDLSAMPGLPFPFDAIDLAAFMVGGVGRWIRAFYGPVEDGPDADRLALMHQHANAARESLAATYMALRDAVSVVGAEPGSNTLEWIEWRRAMVRKLHEMRQGSPSTPAVAGPELVATSAEAVPVQGAGTVKHSTKSPSRSSSPPKRHHPAQSIHDPGGSIFIDTFRHVTSDNAIPVRRTFGAWIRQRRKALDLTQDSLGLLVSCSPHAIRKIEADERRPSHRLAARLCEHLAVPALQHAAFMKAARAVNGLATAANSMLFGASPDCDSVVDGQSDRSSSRTRPPFVGRFREMRALRSWLAQLPVHHGRVVLVKGEVGIGKTRLLDELIAHATQAGFATVRSKCHEIEREIPYGSLVALIEQGTALATEDIEGHLDPAARAELAILVPSLSRRWSNLPQLSGELPQLRQVRLFSAVQTLLQTVAQSVGLLLVLDDVQWLDEATALALHHLVSHLPGMRVLVVVSCRSEDLHADERLARMVQGLHECGPAETLSLSGLSEVEVGEVLQRTLVAPSSDLTPVVQAWSAEWLSQVHAWCRGNPLFLVAAMTEGLVLGGELPSMLRSSKQGMNTSMSAVQIAIRGRLDRLSMPALRLVEVAATMGRAADFELMQAVAVDLSRGEDASVSWLDALEELLRQQWLLDDEESDGYDFQHDRVREAVLAEMTWPRRQALHISIACQLGTREQPEHALMAEHEECAHRWSAAAELWLRAGMQAEALFAVQKAIAHYTKGLRLVEEHAIKTPSTLANDLLERRGLAHVWLSRAEEAAVDLRPAVHRAVSQHRTGRAVELLIELGMCYQRADHYALGAATLHQALDLARELNDANAIATAMWWLADIEWTLDNNRASHHWFRQVMSLCESATVRDDILIKAHHGLGEVAAFDSRPAEAQAHFARSLALACRTGDVRMRCENLTIIAWAHLGACGTGQYDVALDHCEQVVALVEQTGMTWYLGPTWVCQGAALAALGRFGAAIDCFQQALGVAQDLGMPRFEAMARTWLAECCLDSERPDLALEHARLARAIMDRTGVRFFSHHLHAVYAHALVRLGRLDDVPDLPQLLADARERWLGHAVLRALDCLTELRFREGDVVAAKRTAREWAAVARAHGVIEMRLRAVAWVSRLHAATSAGHRNLRRTEHLLRLATPLGRFSLTLSLRREVVRCWQGGVDDFAHRDAVKALEASLAAAHPLLEAVSLA